MKYTVIPNTKNTCWIWIAIDRHAKHLLGFVCDRRDTKTFKRLYNQLNINNINFCSNYWKAYQEVIPAYKHLQSKAQTFTVEGYRSRYVIILQGLNVKLDAQIALKSLSFAILKSYQPNTLLKQHQTYRQGRHSRHQAIDGFMSHCIAFGGGQ